MYLTRLFTVQLLFMISCQTETDYQKDLIFMREHTDVVELSSPDLPNSRIMVIPSYQGRVMTSTANDKSYGWINYELIKSGEIMPHMNAFGGEERIWLSPEGGQFSIYFKPNVAFDFENWQTPSVIDTEAFEILSKTETEVQFSNTAVLKNHSGTTFEIEILRVVKSLTKSDIEKSLGMQLGNSIKTVAYESVNELVNKGKDWDKESGTLGIWLLGMFKPSDKTILVAPFNFSNNLGLTDDYFGKIPSNRLVLIDSTILFKGDGKLRGKIGLNSTSAKPVSGAWDAENEVLTIIIFDLDRNGDYLKSSWEIHKKPYTGDAFNAYNDGITEDGTQMGPFIELESNSPTRALKSEERIVHSQKTFHFEGDKAELDIISQKMLGISLAKIESSMN
jgi:hypothetical protein